MNDAATIPNCRACGVAVRIPQREIDRLVVEYFQERPVAKVSPQTYANRLELCLECPNLSYGTTCKRCGCLVAVRAWIAEKGCPDTRDRWSACCHSAGIADTSDVSPSVSAGPQASLVAASKD